MQGWAGSRAPRDMAGMVPVQLSGTGPCRAHRVGGSRVWLNPGTDVQVISMLAQSSEFGQMQARPWLTCAVGTIKSSWCLPT